MKKLNNKGFALVETLVVSVFVVTIFTLIFTNFYPLIGEYTKRETYDDTDGKYAAYWMRTIVEDNISKNTTVLNTLKTQVDSNKYYYKLDCNNASFNDNVKTLCVNLSTKFNIKNMYITKYNLTNLKSIDNSGGFSRGMEEYVIYLPRYVKVSSNNASYRILIEMNRTKDGNDYNAYSTMEVFI